LLTMPVVMMSGHGTIETAVEATRIGAVDFLEKPISLQKLLNTVTRAIRTEVHLAQEVLIEPQNNLTVEIAGVEQQYALPLDLPLRQARDYFDSIYFQYHLQKEDENITRIAEKIGVERTHLYRKLKQLGIKLSKRGSSDKH